jgi:hypothetical protein
MAGSLIFPHTNPRDETSIEYDRDELRVRFAMSSRRTLVLSLVGFLGFSSALHPQQAKMPTLDEILGRLEANLNHYDKRLPSLFCDEHLVSKVEPGQPNENTVTDSLFRLKRTGDANQTTALVESREIKSVNGKPATSESMKGPSLLNGAFEGGLDVVSLNQKSCMRYELERINGRRPTEPYAIRFSTVLTRDNSAECLLQEKSKGRALIDRGSMQIMHMELTTPHHVIIPANGYLPAVIGERVITVDYAPVVLGGESFWLPSSITSRDTGDANTFHRTTWSFQATYRNYHRLEVTSRILPGLEVPAK